jgi:hypothetical protein
MTLCVIPIVASCAVFSVTSSLPFDLAEEAAIASPPRLPSAGRGLAEALGTAHVPWRAAGAIAMALAGIAAGALAWRLSGRLETAAIVVIAASTHAAAIAASASVTGVTCLLAIASGLAAAAVWRRGLACRLAAGALLAIACMAAPWAWGRLPAASVRLLFNRAPDAALPAVAASGLAAALVIASLFALPRQPRLRLPCWVAAIAFASMGLAAAWKAIAQERPHRFELQRFLERLDAFPPITGASAAELIVGAPVRSPAELSLARPGRHIAPGLDVLGGAARLRVAKWGPPGADGLLAALPSEIAILVEAEIDSAIRLLNPDPFASLPALRAEDEPEFRFSLDAEAPDPHDVRVLVLAETPEGTRAIVRELDEATLQVETHAGAPVLAWRPSWRPMCHAERELRWEDGDLCPRGSALWWTVVIHTPEGARMAPPRRLSVLP